MNEKQAYLSFLATDDFLPGVRVLAYSLARTRPKAPLLVLVTDNLSPDTLADLYRMGIETRLVDSIRPPEGTAVGEDRWNHNFTKLRIFEQTQFDKIVYLDADMVVCANIDELFDHPHMSAVSAGSKMRENAHWTGLNAGLMVIEPKQMLFDQMLAEMARMDLGCEADQSFLHSFYPDWVDQEALHLDHAYNMLHLFLQPYCGRFGYRFINRRTPPSTRIENKKIIKVIHYIGPDKPWFNPDATRRQIRRSWWRKRNLSRALKLWLQLNAEALASRANGLEGEPESNRRI